MTDIISEAAELAARVARYTREGYLPVDEAFQTITRLNVDALPEQDPSDVAAREEIAGTGGRYHLSEVVQGLPPMVEPWDAVPEPVAPPVKEYTGSSVSYYQVDVASPTTEGRAPYTAECNDIIEALGMSFAEGNAFKAIWRRAAARNGLSKRGYTDGLYDAEKVVFFGKRMVAMEGTR